MILEWARKTDPESPIGFFMNVTGSPYDPDGRVLAIRLAARSSGTSDETTVLYDLTLPSPLLGQLLEWVETRTVVVTDVVTTVTWSHAKWGVVPTIIGDLSIAATYLMKPSIAVTCHETASTYQKLLDTRAEIDRRKLTLPYGLDLFVAAQLARQAAIGYNRLGPTDETLHPTWRVRHDDGYSGRITSASPALGNTSHAARQFFRAVPFHRWVCVRWRDPEITLIAARSGCPFFGKLARQANPYQTLATLWGGKENETAAVVPLTEDEARRTLYGILACGLDGDRLTKKNIDPARAQTLMTHAPKFVEWVERVTTHADRFGLVCSPLGVVVKADGHNAVARDIQEAEAECLKMVLAQILGDVESRSDTLAGFRACIPLYNRVFFQVDEHVPIERLIPYLQHVAALAPGHDFQFQVEVEVGGNWGEMRRVDHEFGQVDADLSQPARFPVICPLCSRWACDEPTLSEHLTDVHNVGAVDVAELLMQARQLPVVDTGNSDVRP